MSSFSRIQLENWLMDIEIKGGRVLDVGGSQNPIRKRLKVFEPDEYKILDLPKPHQENNKVDIICDIQDMDDYNVRDKFVRYFDTAFCLEVSEYWIRPFKALENISCLLKEGGILWSSFHFLYPIHNPIEQDYLRYTPKGVVKLLKETGFEILEMRPRPFRHNEMWRDFYVNEGMRPAKDYDKHNWQGCLCKCKKL